MTPVSLLSFSRFRQRSDADREPEIPLQDRSDADLLTRFVQHSDEAAFEVLVQRYQRLVFSVAMRQLNDPERAEDVFQATFVVLLEKAKTIRKRNSLAAWLHGTTRRIALRLLSTREATAMSVHTTAAETEGATIHDVASTDGHEPWQSIRNQFEQETLDEELNRLPERFRAPLVLFYLEGLTGREVSERLGLTVATVEGRLKQARDKLRRRLILRGVSFSAVFAIMQSTSVEAAVPSLLASNSVSASLTASETVLTNCSSAATKLASQEIIAMTISKAVLYSSITGAILLGAGLSYGWAHSPESADGTGTGTGLAAAPLLQVDSLQITEQEQNTELAQFDTGGFGGESSVPLVGTKKTRDLEAARERQKKTNQNAKGGNDPFGSEVAIGSKTLPDEISQFGPSSPASEKIETALQEKTEFEFVDLPLSDVIDYIGELHKVNIVIDKVALEEIGIPTDSAVNLVVKDVSLRSGLKLMLDDFDLTWIVEDEVLKITSNEKMASVLETIIYDISPFGMEPLLLAELMENTVSGPWMSVDGDGGTIMPVPDGKGIVVRANQRQHEEARAFFAQMLQYKKKQ